VAFETNDLPSICRAFDVSVLQSGSIIEVARAAGLDRVTLYRAFRLEKGPALHNMIKVLRVLGFRLVVEVCSEPSSHIGMPAGAGERKRKQAAAVARRFTAAFEAGEMAALGKVFKETLYAQQNVAEFAAKTNRSREALYRAFTQNPTPRFSTLLSCLNAFGLRFAVRRVPNVLRKGKMT
jgi:DNA-binding phage protein